MKSFFKGFVYVILFLAGFSAIIFIAVCFSKWAESAGDLVPVVINTVFSAIMFGIGTFFFVKFCKSFIAMVFPKKYKPVLVEVVDIDVYYGEYTDGYSPMVKRLDDFGNPPHIVAPKYNKYYEQNERDKAYALIGTRMTLFARDNAPYELYFEDNLEKGSTIGWTLTYLFIAILCFVFFGFIFNMLIGLLFRGETFDWTAYWESVRENGY
ncbi:MAG: hypothetical protein ACI4M3_00250 [Acutalibacteraceae bacterium]